MTEKINPEQAARKMFVSHTAIGKQQVKKLNAILQNFLDMGDSIQFRNPVDWKTFNLLDYPMIIKRPMDLNTVKKNINLNHYNEVEACLIDIQLIWQNCKAYNPKQTWIHKQAQKLQKSYRKMIKNYLPIVILEGSTQQKKLKKEQAPPKKVAQKVQQKSQPKNYNEIKNQKMDPQPMLSEQDANTIIRKNFLDFINICTPDQLGIVFLLLHKNTPQVITYNQDGHAVINVQHIDDEMIHRLLQQFDMWGLAYIPSSKKGK